MKFIEKILIKIGIKYIIIIGRFVDCKFVKDFFLEKFKIYCIIILFEVGFVFLKGVVYFGYI